jgi:cell division protein FtsI/penicillin-binding protein 2
MLRRHAIGVLLGAAAARADAEGTAVLVDVRTRRLISVRDRALAGGMLAPPGSTLKPFSLSVLLQAGKLRAADEFACPHNLEIAGRSFACSHPPGLMQVRTALAFSCNCFVAHFAERLAPGELASALARVGFRSRSGLLGESEVSGDIRTADTRLQAIGEAGVLVTAAEMAMAYRRLALDATEPIRSGLEAAVELGTAQQAQIARVKVAGKTGSVRAADGSFLAWFAGFAPSRAPEVAIAVMLQGKSGGADAAPVAARMLEAHFRGRS